MIGLEVAPMAAHEVRLAAVLAADAIDLAPAGQEVVIDEAGDAEAVGDDAALGEVLASQDAMGTGQIHTRQTDFLFAL